MITNADTIKEAARVEDIVGDFVTLKHKGTNLMACCPFHAERTPSFAVNPARGIFKCFGCGKGGDAITFLRENGMEYPDALRHIAKKYGIEIQETANGEMDVEMTKKMQVRATASVLQAHFAMSEADTSPGLKYWLERGFKPETLDEFGIGYCDGSKPAHIADADLSDVGATNEKGNLIFYRRSTIPLHDKSGNVIGWAGRSIEQDDTKAKYINSPTTVIYNKSTHLFNLHRAAKSIRAKQEVWLVEGYADVMAAWQSGIHNVVGLCGTALTDAHVNQLRKFNGDKPLRIVLALDNETTRTGDDEAARTYKASVALAYYTAMEKLLALGEVVRFVYPKSKGKSRPKDIADVVGQGIDPETCEKRDAIEDYVEQKLNEGDFSKKASAVQIADFQNEVAKLIGAIGKENVRTVYINRLANIIKTGPRELDKMVKESRTEAETEQKNRTVSEYRYIKVGDEYYQRIIDYDIFTQTSNTVYRRRKRQELITEGVSISAIPRFHDWIILPSHTNYQRVFEKYDSDYGETFRFFNSYNPLPHKPREFKLPDEFLSDPENFDYEKIPEIKHTAALMKHLFDFDNYGNKYLSVGWDWVALCYLKPTQRQRALCLVSTEEGTGKSTFINLMLAVFGQNATKTEASRIGKDFNAFTAGKVIQCVEETKDERGMVENKLKDLIASFDKVIEPKHQDARVVKSFDKYIFASNHEDSFMKVGHGTTRFIIMKVCSIKEKIPNFEDRLYLEIPYLLYFMQKRGIVHPEKDRFWHAQELIENEALTRLRQSSKDNVERNIEDLFERIFLAVTPINPILSFTSGDIMKMMVAYAGRSYEQKTVNYFQDVCVRMGCAYTKSTRRRVYKIEGLYPGGDVAGELSAEALQGKFLEFPLWKFCDPEQVHEFYPSDKLKALIANLEKTELDSDAAAWLESIKSFTTAPTQVGEELPF